MPKHQNETQIPKHHPRNNTQTRCNCSCKSTRVVYLVTWKRCHKQYVGQTLGSLCIRLQKMKADVKCNAPRESANHFRNNQHTISDIQMEAIDHVDAQMDKKQQKKNYAEKETHWMDQHTIHNSTPAWVSTTSPPALQEEQNELME